MVPPNRNKKIADVVDQGPTPAIAENIMELMRGRGNLTVRGVALTEETTIAKSQKLSKSTLEVLHAMSKDKICKNSLVSLARLPRL